MEGQIDVWRMRLDLSDERIDQYSQLLDEYEKTRAASYMHEENRRQYIVSHGQMRQILSSYVNAADINLKIRQARGEKPRLVNESLFFNLSHSGNYALVAVSFTGEVGIDIECQSEKDLLHTVGKSTFSPTEYQSICQMDISKQNEAFFKCWTRKEAFIKAIGLGFSYNTKSFTVSTDLDKPARFLFFDKNDYRADQWNLVSFQPFANTQAALAFSFALKGLCYRELDSAISPANEAAKRNQL